jgi:hypothetical protein
MSDDPRNAARTARESFARALNMLQDPSLPPAFLQAAEPIAKSMGMLMSVERSDGRSASVRGFAEQALGSAREALARLQGLPSNVPAAEQAMAAVAGALGTVHALSRFQSAPPPPQAAPPQPAWQPPPQAAASAPAAWQPPPQAAPAPAAWQPAPQAAPPVPAAFDPFAAPPRPAPVPSFQQPATPPTAAGAPAAPPDGATIAPPPGTIEAELGAHSPSNFYKTLSGNDIVDHGGIFVATYNVPRLNTRIVIRVHLPGGYYFDAQAVVKWVRDMGDNSDAPPGFGAQLLGVTAEHRQLIMRYVRNREPLFYDDL